MSFNKNQFIGIYMNDVIAFGSNIFKLVKISLKYSFSSETKNK